MRHNALYIHNPWSLVKLICPTYKWAQAAKFSANSQVTPRRVEWSEETKDEVICLRPDTP